MERKLIFITCFFITLFFSCQEKKDNKKEKNTAIVSTQKEGSKQVDLNVFNFESFKPYLEKQDDKTHVINFWATWCAPCVKELPYFEELNLNYSKNNVEVVLVSLDFPHAYDKKLKPFILKNNLKSEVIALDDVDANSWIPKVNENWSGSIPATIIYRNKKSKFYEKSFTYEELEQEVKQFLN